MTNQIEFNRVPNDVNGNPRYVFHYTEVNLTKEERTGNILDHYKTAVAKCNKVLNARAYRAKRYGGGIVVTTNLSPSQLEKLILGL